MSYGVAAAKNFYGVELLRNGDKISFLILSGEE